MMNKIVRVTNCSNALKAMSVVAWASELADPTWELGATEYWVTSTVLVGWDTPEGVCGDLRTISDNVTLICDAPDVVPGVYMVTGPRTLAEVHLSDEDVLAHIHVTDAGMVPVPSQESYAVSGDYVQELPVWKAWSLVGAVSAVKESGVPYRGHGLKNGGYVLCLRWDASPIWLKTI